MTELLLYISGKITGDSDYFIRFSKAEMSLRKAGFNVANPALAPEGLMKGTYMRMAFAHIDEADAVVMLPNWEDSAGAKLEKAYAEYTGKVVFDWADFLTIKEVIT